MEQIEGTPAQLRNAQSDDAAGPTPKVQKVIVIGAGMSGLAAARELQERGYEVLIVEARERLGGRLKSVDLENAASVDLGGALIHGIDENPLHDIVVEGLGIQTQPVSDCLLLTESGWPVDPRNDEKTSAQFNECLEETFQHIQERKSRKGRKESFGKLFDEVCKDKKVNVDELFKWHQANLELSCGAGFQQLGYQWNDDEPYGFDGEHVAIPTSWTSVCEKLAEPLQIIYQQPISSISVVEDEPTIRRIAGEPIQTNEEVRHTPTRRHQLSSKDTTPTTPSRQSRRLRGEDPSLGRRGDRSRRPVDFFTVGHSTEQYHRSPAKRQRQAKTKVHVKLESGSTLLADAVVCTVPLGVMKQNSIEFDPPLSQAKQRAIGSLGTGLLNKCAISFPTRFWPESDFLGLADAEHSYLILNAASFTEHPVLIFLFGGTFAAKVETWTDSAVVEDCLRVLSRICSRTVPKPLDYQVTRWGQDPFSLMSFTFIPPGCNIDELGVLAQPICAKSNGCPVVLFAGEHTTRFHPSTIHGAFLSGIREAYRLDCFISPNENNHLEFSDDEIYYPTFADSTMSSPAAAIGPAVQESQPSARPPRRGTKVQLQQRGETSGGGKLPHHSTPQSPSRRSHRSKVAESTTATDEQPIGDIDDLQRRVLQRSIQSFGLNYELISSMVLPIFGQDTTRRYRPDEVRKLCRQVQEPKKKKSLPSQWVQGKAHHALRHGFRASPVSTPSRDTFKTRSGRTSKPMANAGSPEKKRTREPITKTRSGRKVTKPS